MVLKNCRLGCKVVRFNEKAVFFLGGDEQLQRGIGKDATFSFGSRMELPLRHPLLLRLWLQTLVCPVLPGPTS